MTDAREQLEQAKKSLGSSLEREFDTYWRMIAPGGLPDPEPQVPFQGYDIDRAWPSAKLAVELDGGGARGHGLPVDCHACGARVRATKKDGTPGRELRVGYPSHYSAKGAARDRRKQNALVEAGWRVLRYTSGQLQDDPAACIEQIVRVLRGEEVQE